MCRGGCRYQHHRESKKAKQASDRTPRLKHLGLLRSNCERAETILVHPRRPVKESAVRASRAGVLHKRHREVDHSLEIDDRDALVRAVEAGKRASVALRRLDEHVMAALDELARASRRQRDAVLVGLDSGSVYDSATGPSLAGRNFGGNTSRIPPIVCPCVPDGPGA